MKLFLKTIFVLAVLALLVLMGLNNRSSVTFALPPVLPKAITQPAALMYFAFFAIGFLTATVIGGSGGKSASGSAPNAKPAKPKLVK
jgi:hypothetical protein